MIDRAPGQDAGRDVENLVGGFGVEIGRDHGADAALAEAPRGRGIGLGDLLLHLHEDLERRLGAAEAFRQQRAIKPVLEQRGNHGLGEAPRPLDLVGLARDQRLQRPRPLDEVETGNLVHVFPRPLFRRLSGFLLGGGAMVVHLPPPIKRGGRSDRPCRQAAARPEVERGLCRPPRRGETQRHRDRRDADAERADIEPEIAVEGVEHPAAGPWPERHAEARKRRNRAEHRAHDARAEKFPHQHGVERHHPAIGEAEHDGERVEFAELADREIGRHAQRLHQQPADQHRLGADAVRHHAEREAAAQSGESGEAVDGDRGQRRDAADHGVAHHVEDRARMRRAAAEMRQRQRDELRRAERLRRAPLHFGRIRAVRAGRCRRLPAPGAPGTRPESAAPRRRFRSPASRCASHRS